MLHSASRVNPAALALARELRRAGLTVELGDGSFRLKKSFEAADKTARRIVIMGEDEVASGILTVKDFSTGIQTKVPRADSRYSALRTPTEGMLIGVRLFGCAMDGERRSLESTQTNLSRSPG